MPTVPKSHKCRELGCKNNKTDRSAFCLIHGGAQTEKGRANSKLYSNSFWQKKRIAQLSKDPLCSCCLSKGKVVEAYHIDHVFPHRQDNERFKRNIFQSLCASCHTMKTKSENKGIFLYWSKHGLVTYTDGDYRRIFCE